MSLLVGIQKISTFAVSRGHNENDSNIVVVGGCIRL